MSTYRDWTRVRLLESVRQAWDRQSHLHLGFDLIITDHARAVQKWLTLFDGSRSTYALLETASVMGLGEVAEGLFTQLVTHGLVVDIQTLPTALGDARLTFDLRASGVSYARTALEIARERQNAKVLIVGSNSLAAYVVDSFERSGILTGYLPQSSRRMTTADVVCADLPTSFVGRTWNDIAREIVQPHIVIVIADVIDIAQLELKYPESLVLPVTVHQTSVEIGPLLHAHGSICTDCIHQHSLKAIDDWSMLLTQWLHTSVAPINLTTNLRNVITEHLVSHVLHLIHSGDTFLLNKSHVMTLPQLWWEIKTWEEFARPECGCTNSEQAGTEDRRQTARL